MPVYSFTTMAFTQYNPANALFRRAFDRGVVRPTKPMIGYLACGTRIPKDKK